MATTVTEKLSFHRVTACEARRVVDFPVDATNLGTETSTAAKCQFAGALAQVLEADFVNANQSAQVQMGQSIFATNRLISYGAASVTIGTGGCVINDHVGAVGPATVLVGFAVHPANLLADVRAKTIAARGALAFLAQCALGFTN